MGFDKAFFRSKSATYGFYAGTEAFYDANFGEINLPTSDRQLAFHTKLTLESRGITGLLGVTTRGGVDSLCADFSQSELLSFWP